MAPKSAKNKKAETPRRQDESPKPSCSVEEYPVILLREVAGGVTRRVMQGQNHQIPKTILMGTIEQPLSERSQLGR